MVLLEHVEERFDRARGLLEIVSHDVRERVERLVDVLEVLVALLALVAGAVCLRDVLDREEDQLLAIDRAAAQPPAVHEHAALSEMNEFGFQFEVSNVRLLLQGSV